jgi:hypothetical protein
MQTPLGMTLLNFAMNLPPNEAFISHGIPSNPAFSHLDMKTTSAGAEEGFILMTST